MWCADVRPSWRFRISWASRSRRMGRQTVQTRWILDGYGWKLLTPKELLVGNFKYQQSSKCRFYLTPKCWIDPASCNGTMKFDWGVDCQRFHVCAQAVVEQIASGFLQIWFKSCVPWFEVLWDDKCFFRNLMWYVFQLRQHIQSIEYTNMCKVIWFNIFIWKQVDESDTKTGQINIKTTPNTFIRHLVDVIVEKSTWAVSCTVFERCRATVLATSSRRWQRLIRMLRRSARWFWMINMAKRCYTMWFHIGNK